MPFTFPWLGQQQGQRGDVGGQSALEAWRHDPNQQTCPCLERCWGWSWFCDLSGTKRYFRKWKISQMYSSSVSPISENINWCTGKKTDRSQIRLNCDAWQDWKTLLMVETESEGFSGDRGMEGKEGPVSFVGSKGNLAWDERFEHYWRNTLSTSYVHMVIYHTGCLF